MLLAGLSQTTGFHLLLIQQAAQASDTFFLRCQALLELFGSSSRSDMRLGLHCFHQFFQALTRNGITQMVKTSQPHSLSLGARQAEPRQLIPQLYTVIHPPEGNLQVVGAGRAHGLSPQQVMHHSRNEWLAECSDDFSTAAIVSSSQASSAPLTPL